MLLEIQISSSLSLTSSNKWRTFFTSRVLFGVFFFFRNHAWKFWVRLIHECGLYTSLYLYFYLDHGKRQWTIPQAINIAIHVIDIRSFNKPSTSTSLAASSVVSFAFSSCPSTSMDSSSGSGTTASFSTKLAFTTFNTPWMSRRTLTLIFEDSPSLLGTTSLIEKSPKKHTHVH